MNTPDITKLLLLYLFSPKQGNRLRQNYLHGRLFRNKFYIQLDSLNTGTQTKLVYFYFYHFAQHTAQHTILILAFPHVIIWYEPLRKFVSIVFAVIICEALLYIFKCWNFRCWGDLELCGEWKNQFYFILMFVQVTWF